MLFPLDDAQFSFDLKLASLWASEDSFKKLRKVQKSLM